MGFLGFGKKKRIPDELPDLISDEIEKEAANEINSALKEDKEVVEKKEESLVKEVENKPSYEEKRRQDHVVNRLIKSVSETPEREVRVERKIDKSFFSELQKNLSSELEDLDSLEGWYNNRFKTRDVLDDMKTYWDKQKKASVLDLLGKNFQEKIDQKVSHLQTLEKDWQLVYFDLIEKEEEIKDAEKELKDLLSEFMNICRHKKRAIQEVSTNFSSNSKNKRRKKNKKKNVQSIVNGEKKESEFNNEKSFIEKK